MTVLEQICGDCERKCNTDSCYEVDVREDTIDDLRLKVEALERKNKSLKADVASWKEVSKLHYSKMVEAKLALKDEKKTSEFLRQEGARKNAQMEFLR